MATPLSLLNDKFTIGNIQLVNLATTPVPLIVAPGAGKYINLWQVFATVSQSFVYSGLSQTASLQLRTSSGVLMASGDTINPLGTVATNTFLGFGTFGFAYKNLPSLNNQGVNLSLNNPLNIVGSNALANIVVYVNYSIDNI